MEDAALKMMVEGGELAIRTAGKSARAVSLMKSLVKNAWSAHRLRASEFSTMYRTSVVNVDMEHAAMFMEKASEAGLPHAALRSTGRDRAELYFRKEDTEKAMEILGDIGIRSPEIKGKYAKKDQADIGLHPADISGERIEAFFIPEDRWEGFVSSAAREGLVFSSEKRRGGHSVCTFVKQDRTLIRVLRQASIAPLSVVRAVIGETGRYKETVESRLGRITAVEEKKKSAHVLVRDAVPEK